MSSPALVRLHNQISAHLEEIAGLFDQRPKITIVIRERWTIGCAKSGRTHANTGRDGSTRASGHWQVRQTQIPDDPSHRRRTERVEEGVKGYEPTRNADLG